MKDLNLYSNLIHLTMNGIGIKSVKNFPKLPKLQIVRLYIILSF
jgi:hypothetical protein